MKDPELRQFQWRHPTTVSAIESVLEMSYVCTYIGHVVRGSDSSEKEK